MAIECEKLEKKYNQTVEMLKNSFVVLKEEIDNHQLEKEKRNLSIVVYKKRLSGQLKELQKKIKFQEKIIDSYKKENLELKRENILLKKKFKKAAVSFTKKKEDNLIYKYFKDSIEIEDFLEKFVDKMIKEKLNPKEITPLYFRKELNTILNTYLIKRLVVYTKIEKISVLLSSIIMNRFHDTIYFFIVSFLVERIEDDKYTEFIKILLTKTLVDKDKKYEPIKMEYSIDDIKIIYSKYKQLSFKKENLSIKIDLKKVDKDIYNCLNKIEKNKKKLKELEIKENDVLVKLTTLEEDEKEDVRKEIEEIDIYKRRLIDNISKLKKELEMLENKKGFLQPANEVVFDNSLKNKEKEIVEKYNEMLNSFAFALERGLQ